MSLQDSLATAAACIFIGSCPEDLNIVCISIICDDDGAPDLELMMQAESRKFAGACRPHGPVLLPHVGTSGSCHGPLVPVNNASNHLMAGYLPILKVLGPLERIF